MLFVDVIVATDGAESRVVGVASRWMAGGAVDRVGVVSLGVASLRLVGVASLGVASLRLVGVVSLATGSLCKLAF